MASSIAPSMIEAPPVRASNLTCPTLPPAPWHMGMPPQALPRRFNRPVEIAILRRVTGCSGNTPARERLIEYGT